MWQDKARRRMQKTQKVDENCATLDGMEECVMEE